MLKGAGYLIDTKGTGAASSTPVREVGLDGVYLDPELLDLGYPRPATRLAPTVASHLRVIARGETDLLFCSRNAGSPAPQWWAALHQPGYLASSGSPSIRSGSSQSSRLPSGSATSWRTPDRIAETSSILGRTRTRQPSANSPQRAMRLGDCPVVSSDQ
jgi:hypothetical protein